MIADASLAEAPVRFDVVCIKPRIPMHQRESFCHGFGVCFRVQTYRLHLIDMERHIAETEALEARLAHPILSAATSTSQIWPN
jgi:hypothetical protein